MAKKSMIAKAKREPKYSTRQHNRCRRCGRPTATTASSVCAVSVFASWPTEANCPA